jgi:glucose dehydrogenase
MRTSRLIAALILALVGLGWVGQGTGMIGGSAMSGSSFWAIVGLVLIVGAVAIVALERRRSAHG